MDGIFLDERLYRFGLGGAKLYIGVVECNRVLSTKDSRHGVVAD
jgi:hypothetical protein